MPEESRSTVRWLVEGRVQGVGFRWFVRKRAAAVGVGGYVRNLPNGSVECVGTGTEEALDLLEIQLEKGPLAARVSSVTRESLVAQDYNDTFSIR